MFGVKENDSFFNGRNLEFMELLLFAQRSWVLAFIVRVTLLGWYMSFVGRKPNKVWKITSLCIF